MKATIQPVRCGEQTMANARTLRPNLKEDREKETHTSHPEKTNNNNHLQLFTNKYEFSVWIKRLFGCCFLFFVYVLTVVTTNERTDGRLLSFSIIIPQNPAKSC